MLHFWRILDPCYVPSTPYARAKQDSKEVPISTLDQANARCNVFIVFIYVRESFKNCTTICWYLNKFDICLIMRVLEVKI